MTDNSTDRVEVTQADRPISEHPCHGLFATAGDRLTHRHWFQDGEVMPTCERCGTPINRKHEETGPISWAPEKRREVVTLTDRYALSRAAMTALGEWLAWPDAGRDGPREVTVAQTLSFLRGLPNKLGYGGSARLAALSGAGGKGLKLAHDIVLDALHLAEGDADAEGQARQALAAVEAALATHPGDHPGDAGEGSLEIQGTSAPAGDGARRGEAFAPGNGERWRERWYGSDPERGSAIVTEAGALVAYFGGDEATHAATTRAVAAHNAVFLDANPDEPFEPNAALSTQATDREKVLEEAVKTERNRIIRVVRRELSKPDSMNPKERASWVIDAIRALAQAPSEAGR